MKQLILGTKLLLIIFLNAEERLHFEDQLCTVKNLPHVINWANTWEMNLNWLYHYCCLRYVVINNKVWNRMSFVLYFYTTTPTHVSTFIANNFLMLLFKISFILRSLSFLSVTPKIKDFVELGRDWKIFNKRFSRLVLVFFVSLQKMLKFERLLTHVAPERTSIRMKRIIMKFWLISIGECQVALLAWKDLPSRWMSLKMNIKN